MNTKKYPYPKTTSEIPILLIIAAIKFVAIIKIKGTILRNDAEKRTATLVKNFEKIDPQKDEVSQIRAMLGAMFPDVLFDLTTVEKTLVLADRGFLQLFQHS